jgi:hypothetical protein
LTAELPRTALPKLAEKGFKQRSERRFARYTEDEMDRKVPFRWTVSYVTSASETFAQFSVGNLAKRNEHY